MVAEVNPEVRRVGFYPSANLCVFRGIQSKCIKPEARRTVEGYKGYTKLHYRKIDLGPPST